MLGFGRAAITWPKVVDAQWGQTGLSVRCGGLEVKHADMMPMPLSASHIHGLRPASIDKFGVLVARLIKFCLMPSSMERVCGTRRGGSRWLLRALGHGLILLTNEEVRTRVRRRLGCDLCKEGPCPFPYVSWTGTACMRVVV